MYQKFYAYRTLIMYPYSDIMGTYKRTATERAESIS